MARYIYPLIFILCINLFATVYEDLTAKEILRKVTSMDISVNGVKGKGEVFYSKFEKTDTMNAWRSHMKAVGFKETGTTRSNISFSRGKEKQNAFFAPGKKGTSVISYTLEGEIAKGKSGEALGIDLSDVPRPKGSVRELCFERLSGGEKAVTQVFSLAGSTASTEQHYKNALLQKGYFPVSLERLKAGISLLFEKQNKWCFVFISDGVVVVSLYEK